LKYPNPSHLSQTTLCCFYSTVPLQFHSSAAANAQNSPTLPHITLKHYHVIFRLPPRSYTVLLFFKLKIYYDNLLKDKLEIFFKFWRCSKKTRRWRKKRSSLFFLFPPVFDKFIFLFHFPCKLHLKEHSLITFLPQYLVLVINSFG